MAARDGAAALAPGARRTLVAMSGGVDSAAAAQLALDAGDDVVAVTLELWSDPATDGEQSCCSPQAVTGARALAHRMGIPHFTLDLRERFRAEVVDDFLAGYAGGAHAQPVRALQRPGALRRHAGAGRRARRRAAGHRPLRPHRARRARARWSARRPIPRKDQSYMLARLDRTRARRACASRSADSRSRACASSPVPPGLPVADKRESQDLCFLAGIGGRAFMRRHGGPACAARGARSWTGDGRVLGRHEGHHDFTVGQRRGLGTGGRRAALRAGQGRPRATAWWWARAPRSPPRT